MITRTPSPTNTQISVAMPNNISPPLPMQTNCPLRMCGVLHHVRVANGAPRIIGAQKHFSIERGDVHDVVPPNIGACLPDTAYTIAPQHHPLLRSIAGDLLLRD